MFGLDVAILNAVAPEPVITKKGASSEHSSKIDKSIRDRVLRSPKALRVWEGSDAGFGSGSDADQYLLNLLAYQTEDEDQIERIYSEAPRASRESSDGTCKWTTRPDYRERSINAALKFVEDHPEGDAAEALATVEAAVALTASSRDVRNIYAPNVLEAFGVLKVADPGSYEHFRNNARKAGVTLSRLDAEIEKVDETRSKLLDTDAADAAIERLGGAGSVLFNRGQWWCWRQELGVWARIDGDETIKQAIHTVLPKRQITGGNVGSVLSVLRTKIARDIEFDRECGTYRVNCANGTLHLVAKTFEEGLRGDFWELRPHRREDYFTSRVPIEWKPGEQSPVFDRFLDSILEGDTDAVYKRRVLIDAIGYSLMTATEQEKFFILYGPTSNNGKSTLLAVIEALAGAENIAALSLKQLGERFSLAKLQGKLVNLCAEIPRGELLPDEHIKKLTTGDVITAEFKGKDHFEFRNKATLWFACNDLPSLRDLSAATLEKRCVLIELNHSFSDEKRDVSLKSKLLAELEGIFWQCVETAGAMSVLSKEVTVWTTKDGEKVSISFMGGFLEDPPSSKAAKAEWRSISDPVKLFADECLVDGGGHFIKCKDLYAAWTAWAENNGVTLKLNSHHLTGRLKRLFPKIETGDAARRGRVRGVAGLGLRGDE